MTTPTRKHLKNANSEKEHLKKDNSEKQMKHINYEQEISGTIQLWKWKYENKKNFGKDNLKMWKK